MPSEFPASCFRRLISEKYGFHDTGPCNIVKHGCHALAVDEHRNEFVPTLWTGTPAGDGKASSKSGSRELIRTSGAATSLENLLTSLSFGWPKKPRQTAWCSIGHAFLIRPNSTHMPRCTNSRTLVFAKDRLTPTFREICGQAFDVSFYERLYAPMDGSGKPLPTINEAIHRSVVEDAKRMHSPVRTIGTVFAIRSRIAQGMSRLF